MATSIDDNAVDGNSGKSYGWLIIIRCTRGKTGKYRDFMAWHSFNFYSAFPYGGLLQYTAAKKFLDSSIRLPYNEYNKKQMQGKEVVHTDWISERGWLVRILMIIVWKASWSSGAKTVVSDGEFHR